MRKRPGLQGLIIGFLLVLTVLAGCGSTPRQSDSPVFAVPIFEADGIKQVSAVKDGHLTIYDGEGWRSPFWAGMNLGATTPGHAPGELSPTKADYLRWFPQIKAMNVNVLRIYTILPPIFYEALLEFNETQAEPLWVLHGIWSPEEELIGENEQGNDAFTPHITEAFRREISDAVRAVHGDLKRPARPGHASGTYRADISPYLLGWLVGTEWHQRAVKVTNDAHPGMAPYVGTYFRAKSEATPFENWLGGMLDHVATEEIRYGWQRPLSFVNWPTTDPLSHPDEANREEDLVSLDPMHLEPTAAFRAGYFTAYHIYPYYPDFLRYETAYQTHRDNSGELNPYAGYLKQMREHHAGIPFIVAEFGVPSSRGMAHRAPRDWNQGMHSEQEQGEINAKLLASIYEEGYDGGILFAWQDEWHKFTWNTKPLEQPADRRPMWRNRLTNEEHFGVLSVEPGRALWTIHLDGQTDDWSRRPQKVQHAYPGFDLSVAHDEAHLFLLLKKREGAWDLEQKAVEIGLDTLPGGSRRADKAPGAACSGGIEFLLQLQQGDAHLFVNSAYDQHIWTWPDVRSALPPGRPYHDAEQGIFLPWKLMLNRALFLPQSKRQIPFEDLEIGAMRFGISDPADPAFDSLADWYVKGDVLEVRIPWMLLGFTDPSTRQVWSYPTADGTVEPVVAEGVTLEFPGTAPFKYTWDGWDQPTYHERLKAGYEAMKQAFGAYTEPKR